MSAYECHLLGVEQLNIYSQSANENAIRLLSRAVELDPSFSQGWDELGFAYAVQGANGYGGNAATSLERFKYCATKALELDPGNSPARQCVGDFLALSGDFEGAIAENTRALRNSPNDSGVLALVAGSRALAAGDPAEGRCLIERALQINALPPVWYFSMLGRVTFVIGSHREAIAAFRRAPQDMPSTHMFLAMAPALLGEMEEANQIAARLASEFPDFNPEMFIAGYPITNPPAVEAIRRGAERMGLA